MSGTSADGVDVAIVRVTGRGLAMRAELVRHLAVPYSRELREKIFAVRKTGATFLADLAELGREISLTYAAAINDALAGTKLTASDLTAVAAHGQTLYHAPPNTIQWLDPSLIAARVGCAVVSDFRRADCAAGGQGAPLVPFADYLLFRHQSRHRVLLNLGGIANLTLVPATSLQSEAAGTASGSSIRAGESDTAYPPSIGAGAADTVGSPSTPASGSPTTASPLTSLIAFDTGPANCISDWLMRELYPEGPGVDEDGRMASLGRADEDLATRVLAADYFRRPPPKSTDGPAMIDLFFDAAGDLGGRPHLPKLLATACLVTAASIARAIRDLLPTFPDELIVSGGGVHNRVMMKALADQLHSVPILTIDALGVPSAAKEAIAFALLGAATIDGEPSNVPSVTGAARAVVLGSITPRP